ncbi:hypothetical protein RI367_006381 [Sorochytrium milnesiophthora]
MFRQLCRQFATVSSTASAADSLRVAAEVSASASAKVSPPASTRVRSTRITTRASPNAAQTSTTPAVTEALQILRDTPPYYALVEIKGRPYHITKGDVVVTNRLTDMPLGTELQLDCIRKFGSKAGYVDGDPYVSTKLADVRAVVIEHWRGKRQVIVKEKRRKGYRRTLEHRQLLTSLRITECECNEPAAILGSRQSLE